MTATAGDAVTRAGRRYPVAVTPLDRPVVDALRIDPLAPPVDTELRRLGAPHLDRLRTAVLAMHDGPVLRWLRTDGDTLVVAPGGYFDMVATCDGARAEGELFLRAVHELASDPLTSGAGRCAALGVTVVATLGLPDAGRFLIGLRSASVATDVGRWHAFPSGMVEPDDAGQPLATTIAAELAEEVGVRLTASTVGARGRVIGLAHDLARLRPDVVVQLPLSDDEWATRAEPVDPEMAEFRWVPLTRDGLEQFWQTHAPDAVTPPLAGAVALLEPRAD